MFEGGDSEHFATSFVICLIKQSFSKMAQQGEVKFKVNKNCLFIIFIAFLIINVTAFIVFFCRSWLINLEQMLVANENKSFRTTLSFGTTYVSSQSPQPPTSENR